jgi:hypothetical protein
MLEPREVHPIAIGNKEDIILHRCHHSAFTERLDTPIMGAEKLSSSYSSSPEAYPTGIQVDKIILSLVKEASGTISKAIRKRLSRCQNQELVYLSKASTCRSVGAELVVHLQRLEKIVFSTAENYKVWRTQMLIWGVQVRNVEFSIKSTEKHSCGYISRVRGDPAHLAERIELEKAILALDTRLRDLVEWAMRDCGMCNGEDGHGEIVMCERCVKESVAQQGVGIAR